MRLGLLVLALGGLLLRAPPAWAADACAGLDPPVPKLEVGMPAAPKPRIVETSEPRIRKLSEQAGSRHAAENVKVPGLTKVEITGEAHYALQATRRGSGPTCTALAGIDARFSDRNVVIYVDQRYPAQSCERQAIMDHEHQHVAIGARMLERWRPRIRDELSQLMQGWAGRWLDTAAQKQLDRQIDAKVRSLVDRIQEDASVANAAIDTPASYKAVTRRCRGW